MLEIHSTEEFFAEVEEYSGLSPKFAKIMKGPRYYDFINALLSKGKSLVGTKNFGRIIVAT